MIELQIIIDNKVSFHSPVSSKNDKIFYMGYECRNLLAQHGFALSIRTEEFLILFDTGSDLQINNCSVLEHNLNHIGIEPNQIDKIVLSHRHTDHVGGLRFLASQPIGKYFDVYCHRNAIYDYIVRLDNSVDLSNSSYNKAKLLSLIKQKKISDIKRNISPVKDNINLKFVKNGEKIGSNLYFLCDLPKTEPLDESSTVYYSLIDNKWVIDNVSDDLSILIKTDEGYHLILGCCHTGLINILNYVEEHYSNEILSIIGGAHMVQKDSISYKERVRKTVDRIKSLPIKFIVPCHCSGDYFSSQIVKNNINLYPSYVGMKIKF
ncbi:MAG: MBL fold metallo-hydrolase [Candidatus Heimdallarchaeaceae archaeon]